MAKILAVDDTKFARNRVVKPLEALGHHVIQGENGEMGLQLFLQEKPELLISDLLMPVMDGIEEVRRIREAGYETPVIIVSADIQNSSREMCDELRVFAFLNKPFQEKELTDLVERALASVVEGVKQ
jgi:CheY-like chemotaxis protein